MSLIVSKELSMDYKKFEDEMVTLKGWIRTNRSNKNIGFIELNDGTQFKNIQLVYDRDLENFIEVEKFSIASAISVTGTVVVTPSANSHLKF